MRKFPKYETHEDAVCFHCGESLRAPKVLDAGFPDGYGRYRKDCPKCPYGTYYDITKKKKT